jgi:hypothetical protein
MVFSLLSTTMFIANFKIQSGLMYSRAPRETFKIVEVDLLATNYPLVKVQTYEKYGFGSQGGVDRWNIACHVETAPA